MTQSFISLVCLGVLTGLTACSTHESTPAAKPQIALATLADSLITEPGCTGKGGTWKKVGRLQAPACVLPTPDAGKSCTDSKQCQTSCLLTGKKVPPGTAVTGECQASTHQFGCHTYVNRGKAEATLCID